VSESKSYAEITLKSGAVVTFDCIKITWKRNQLGIGTLEWETPAGATRRPVHFDLDEIAAIVFVDDSQ
jgi:hypothetical protein